MVGLQELETSEKWVANGDKPCALYRMEIGDRIASKGVAIVKFNIEKVVTFLEKEDTLQKLNPDLLEKKTLHAVKDHFKVLYQQYKAVWPVSNRDFVSVSHLFRVNGKVYLGTKSVNYPYPEVKGVVRAEIFIGGYIIEKIDENTTRITYISDSDAKGSIPGMIKNTVTQKQGGIAATIGPVMEKEGY